MLERWPTIVLGEVMRHRKEFITIDDLQTYRRCRVQSRAQGIVWRDTVVGADITTKRQQVCRAGEFLVAEIDAKVGGYGIVPEDLDGAIVSSHYFLFVIDRERLDPRFMSYLVRTRSFFDQVHAHGSTNYAAVEPEDVLAFRVALPPLTEQRCIAARVQHLADRIADIQAPRREAAAELDAMAGAYLNRLFGDAYQNKPGTLGMTNHVRIGDVASDVADGPHVTPHYVDVGIPFVTVLNITSGRVVFSGLKHITPDDHWQYAKRARAERGDVLISKDGTIGIPCFVDTDREFSFFVSVALIKPVRAVLDGQFLTWVLRAPYLQRRMRERSRGDMIRHLVLREIRDLLVPLPSLAEQVRTVADLDGLQARIDAARRLQAEAATELEALLPSTLARVLDVGR